MTHQAMGVALAVLLAVFVGAHVWLVAGLARSRAPGRVARAVVAFFVPPLAPWWGHRAGLRITAFVWCAALALYAAGVVLAPALSSR